MSEYGITKTGVNIKRFDTILDELHDDLSRGWSINTRVNPDSYLNVQLTAFADKIAELWEFGQQIYNNYYPSSAEGASLDAACQYSGVGRQAAARTVYPIHCTGKDGTLLEAGTIVSSDTNPRIDFFLTSAKTIERAAFNSAVIRVVIVSESTYTVSINGMVYPYSASSGDDQESILTGLALKIRDGGLFDAKVVKGATAESAKLQISAMDVAQNYTMLLTENLTTESVTSIISFSSEDYGEINVPDGAISVVTKGPADFTECINRCSYIAGRLLETDTELRQSYADKIYNLSSRTLQAIRAAILSNVQGVTSVAAYENDKDVVDDEGRYPHSIELIVDGGSPAEIAEQIFRRKAGGISTFGSIESEVIGDNGESITIRFNRPSYVYIWWHISIIQDTATHLPTDYAKQIKEIISEEMGKLETGDDVIPQKVFKAIYANVSGIAYIDVKIFATTDPAKSPVAEDFALRSLALTDRERGITKETMIEVALDG